MIINVITFAKSLLVCQVMYSQASGIKASSRHYDFFFNINAEGNLWAGSRSRKWRGSERESPQHWWRVCLLPSLLFCHHRIQGKGGWGVPFSWYDNWDSEILHGISKTQLFQGAQNSPNSFQQCHATGSATRIRCHMCLARFYDSDMGLCININLQLVTSQSKKLTFLMLFLKGETYFVKSFSSLGGSENIPAFLAEPKEMLFSKSK